ncbi:MAG TPA: hypothetical protein VEQ61_10300 [Thermoleophilaceae bacterium]|nr:hypothetical protein [Thermoleophilaceae bacterium]
MSIYVRALGIGLAALGLLCPAATAHDAVGELTGLHNDSFARGSSTTEWTLEQGARRISVLPTELPALAPGETTVSVAASEEDGALVGPVRSLDAPQSLVSGARRVAVILVDFAGAPTATKPWTPAHVSERIFSGTGSTNAFFREESYDRLSLQGRVYGWYTIPGTSSSCSSTNWSAARQAAAADGFSSANYEHVMYVFPRQSSCAWAGQAYLPGKESWLNGDISAHVSSHELGHNLGLHHAGSLSCVAANGAPVTLSPNCSLTEYGDPFDAMGGYASRHNHGLHLRRLGFSSESNVQTVGASGLYTLQSALTETSQPTTLRIPRRRDPYGTVLDWYYLEVRESGGVFDNFGIADAAVQGVSIRLNDDPSRTEPTQLLDTNPTGGGIWNAPLAVNRTFSDGAISMTTVSAGSGRATVRVALPGTPAAALPPTPAPAPATPAPPAGDTQAPTAPAAPRGSRSSAGVRLDWGASSDNTGVARYVVSRNGIGIGSSGTNLFVDRSAPAGAHAYVVHAEDAAANRSRASAPVTVPAADTRRPSVRLRRSRRSRGRLLLRVTARDDRRVARVELWIDGRRRKAARRSSLSYVWSARRGRHRLLVKAVDTSGNRAYSRLRLRRP